MEYASTNPASRVGDERTKLREFISTDNQAKTQYNADDADIEYANNG